MTLEPHVPDFQDPLENYDPPEYPDAVAEKLGERPVSAMRIIPFAEISPQTTVESAIQALVGLGVSSLLVVEDHELCGILTERDILDRVSEQYEKLKLKPVAEIMTNNPLVLREDLASGAALSAIAASGYRHVPVIDQRGKLKGVTSPRRMFEFLEPELSQI